MLMFFLVKPFLILILFFAIGSMPSVAGQTTVPGDQSSRSSLKGKRVNLYYHLGSVEVPNGSSGFLTADWNDAWCGYFQMPSDGLRINWCAGLVEKLFEKRKKHFVWIKDESTADLSKKSGLIKEKGKSTIVAAIGDIEFSAAIDSETDQELFFEVIRSYSRERCSSCTSLPREVQRKKT